MIAEKRLISNHQFVFRNKHTIFEQIQKQNYLQNYKITLAFEIKKYCSAMFLNVS